MCFGWVVGSKVAGVPESRLVVAQSCDKAKVPQAVLVRRSQNIGCVHADVLEAVEDEAATFINSIVPGPTASLAEKIDGYMAMEDYLMTNSEWALRPERSAFCLGKRFENEHALTFVMSPPHPLMA